MRAQREVVERLADLEEFQRLTVGRELRMIELKKEIEYLRKLSPLSATSLTAEGDSMVLKRDGAGGLRQ